MMKGVGLGPTSLTDLEHQYLTIVNRYNPPPNPTLFSVERINENEKLKRFIIT